MMSVKCYHINSLSPRPTSVKLPDHCSDDIKALNVTFFLLLYKIPLQEYNTYIQNITHAIHRMPFYGNLTYPQTLLENKWSYQWTPSSTAVCSLQENICLLQIKRWYTVRGQDLKITNLNWSSLFALVSASINCPDEFNVWLSSYKKMPEDFLVVPNDMLCFSKSIAWPSFITNHWW